MAMRSGKTRTVLEWVAQDVQGRVLVVCPPKVIGVWEAEKERLELGDRVAVHSDCRMDKIEGKFAVVVIDEIHRFRHRSNRLRNLKRLCRGVRMKMGLTGTPNHSDFFVDAFEYLSLLSDNEFYGTDNRWCFYEAACEQTRQGPGEHFRVKDEYEKALWEELKGSAFFHKDDTRVIPPELVKAGYPMTPEQDDIVHSLYHWRRTGDAELDVDDLEGAVWKAKAEQVLGGFYLRDGKVAREFATSKWIYLRALSSQIYGRVLIFYKYVEERERILEVFKDSSRVVVTADKKGLEAFRSGEADILLAHPRSAGTGLDLSMAEALVFTGGGHSVPDLCQAAYRASGKDSRQRRCFLLFPKGMDDDWRRIQKQWDEWMGIYAKGQQTTA